MVILNFATIFVKIEPSKSLHMVFSFPPLAETKIFANCYYSKHGIIVSSNSAFFNMFLFRSERERASLSQQLIDVLGNLALVNCKDSDECIFNWGQFFWCYVNHSLRFSQSHSELGESGFDKEVTTDCSTSRSS